MEWRCVQEEKGGIFVGLLRMYPIRNVPYIGSRAGMHILPQTSPCLTLVSRMLA